MEDIDKLGERLRIAIEEARERLDALETARDRAIKLSRDIVSHSGKAITYMLSGKFDEALKELEELDRAKKEFDESLDGYPELKYAGFAQSAYSEYVEAILLSSMLMRRDMPRPSDIDVHPVPYLLGLADLVGELRRLCLERVREERLTEAFSLLIFMEQAYLRLRELDYPEPLTPGLRHKVDTLRKGLEDLRALLIDIENRERLKDALQRLKM